MRILLDNCVTADLVQHIRGHDVVTAVEMGWDALDDGPLLDAMAGRFAVLLTVDKSMRFQQLIAGRPVALIVMRARSNRVEHLARLVPELQRVLRTIRPGEFRVIESG